MPSKNPLPRQVRMRLWKIHHGLLAEGPCYVCQSTISILDFQAGHVIAQSNGGSNTVENLRPICQACNLKMATQNLEDFKMEFYPGKTTTSLNDFERSLLTVARELPLLLPAIYGNTKDTSLQTKYDRLLAEKQKLATENTQLLKKNQDMSKKIRIYQNIIDEKQRDQFQTVVSDQQLFNKYIAGRQL